MKKPVLVYFVLLLPLFRLLLASCFIENSRTGSKAYFTVYRGFSYNLSICCPHYILVILVRVCWVVFWCCVE